VRRSRGSRKSFVAWRGIIQVWFSLVDERGTWVSLRVKSVGMTKLSVVLAGGESFKGALTTALSLHLTCRVDGRSPFAIKVRHSA
jgi:hypothetical protein